MGALQPARGVDWPRPGENAKCIAWARRLPSRADSLANDRDTVRDKNVRKRTTCELAALIGVEDLRPAIEPQSLVDSVNAKLRTKSDRKTPGQNAARKPVHDPGEVEETACHWD